MKIAFITGSSRSGTSILGELIASHQQVSYVFEEPVWKKMEDKNTVDEKKKIKLRNWMNCYAKGDKIIVEKNPRHIVKLPLLKQIFPEAKFIHIVRDGRDVACSLKTGLCGKTWAHVKSPNWKEIESKYDGIIRCAWAWRDVMETAIKDLKKINHFQVKYEDLISDPQNTANKVLSYLELSADLKVLEFCDKIQNETKDSYNAKHQTRWQLEDHSVRIGRWQENMTAEEQIEVEKILRPILNHFGYK